MYACFVILFCFGNLHESTQISLNGSPKNVITGEQFTITLTCRTEYQILKWRGLDSEIAVITDLNDSMCIFSGTPNLNYSYTCDSDNGIYVYRLSTNLTVTADFITNQWFCSSLNPFETANFSFDVSVPVTTIAMKPAGHNNSLDVIEGKTRIFTCTTGLSRPAALIHWYIGQQNVTNQTRIFQTLQQDGYNFISLSILNYTGQNADHMKVIYCEAVNIENKYKVRSKHNFLFIQIPITSVTISPAGDNNTIHVVAGESKTFTCTTTTSRPNAWIQWYIGQQNVTLDAVPLHDDNTLLSSSTLVYKGKDSDHNKNIYCEAVNIEGSDKFNSTVKSIYIQVPVKTVTIKPGGNSNEIAVVVNTTHRLTCTTDASRPAGRIQWYIGEQNVTLQSQSDKPQMNGSKFISTSRLDYTGKTDDHNKSMYCEAVNIENIDKVKSIMASIFIQIPVTMVTITPAGDNNVIAVVEGENKTLTCTTDAGRPVARIHWYIGEDNVTNKAQPQPLRKGNEFISLSVLHYTGNDANHNSVIHCEAVNIEDRDTVKSTNKSIFIQLPVKNVTITTEGDINDDVHVVEGETRSFTCTTDASRPAGWIHWFIGSQNVTYQAQPKKTTQIGGKFISSSMLNYTGHDVDHNNTVFCKAANLVEKQAVKSLKKTLVIQFGPKNISLDTTQIEYTVTEKKSIKTINCSATCRPNCKLNWTGPNGLESDNHLFQLGPVYRNQTGQYICNARNAFGIGSSHRIQIIVNYSPSIVKMTVNNDTSENKSAIFQCVVESRPASNITWKNGSSVLSASLNVHQSNYTIEKAKCLQSGTYQCQAKNIIEGKEQSVVAEIDFLVLCSVRHDDRRSDIVDDIGINDDDPLNITEYLIAYPKPSIKWTFKNDSINSYDTIGTFLHHTSILKWQIGKSDFGVYTLNASNQIGDPYVRTFNVFPQRKPTPPTNITVLCDIISMEVFWRSESNGGDKQMFSVLWLNQAENNTIYSREIDDMGEGKYHSETTDSLNPNTFYLVSVQASNSHGTVTSSEHMNCTTKRKVTEESFAVGPLIGGILGSLCGVIVVLAAILLYSRRTKYSNDDREPIRRKKNVEVADEDDEGLKDNPLYLSSAQASGVDNGPLYSIVNTKSKLEANKVTPQYVDQGPVYSQIQKPGKKGRQERKEKKANKQDKKEQHESGIELGSVYENSELQSSINQSDCALYGNSAGQDSQFALIKNNYKPSKNKDGLIYADLDLAPGGTGKKFVIRGLENRNNYAIIDLTKTAEPLPSSDEDDEKENK